MSGARGVSATNNPVRLPAWTAQRTNAGGKAAASRKAGSWFASRALSSVRCVAQAREERRGLAGRLAA